MVLKSGFGFEIPSCKNRKIVCRDQLEAFIAGLEMYLFE